MGAGLGPFGLLWVGLWTFIMYASGYSQLGEGSNTAFAFIYFFLNSGLLFLHWWFSPEIYAWTKKAPAVKAKASDEAMETADSDMDEPAPKVVEPEPEPKPEPEPEPEPTPPAEPEPVEPEVGETTVKETIKEKVAEKLADTGAE